MATRHLTAYLFDMDGVLYRGRQALPGARTLLAALDRSGIPYALVTNNSTRTARQYVTHLRAMGMRVPGRRIVTSSEGTAVHLRRLLRPGARVLVLGEPALRRSVARAGFTVASDRVAAVVVGLDRRVTYAKLARATEALVRGALFVASNPDPLLPTSDGIVPGAGSLVAALAYAAGRRPTVIGKPHPRLLLEAASRLGVRPEETAMVGDQVHTDVAAGRAAKMFTVLVQSGLAGVRAQRRGPRPHLTVRDLRALREWIDGRGRGAAARRRARRPSRSGAGAAPRG